MKTSLSSKKYQIRIGIRIADFFFVFVIEVLISHDYHIRIFDSSILLTYIANLENLESQLGYFFHSQTVCLNFNNPERSRNFQTNNFFNK